MLPGPQRREYEPGLVPVRARSSTLATLGSEVGERLDRFVRLVLTWNRAQHLVSGRLSERGLWELVEDSLAGAALLPAQGRVLDVGSGAGLPVIPLLIVRPEIHGTLIEPRERRWAFLREAMRELGIDAEVRRERLDGVREEGWDALTVRGVECGVWRDRAPRLLKAGGWVVWWTSAQAVEEARLDGRVVGYPVLGAGRGCIVVWTPCFT